MKSSLKSLISGGMLVLLAGCSTSSLSSHFNRSAPDATSVDYRYSVSVEKIGIVRARDQLDAYIYLNQHALADFGAQLQYQGELGAKLAERAYRTLLQKGIAEEKLSLQEVEGGTLINKVSMTTHIHQNSVTKCQSSVSQTAYLVDGICVIETLQWENRVYPETEIADTSISINKNHISF